MAPPRQASPVRLAIVDDDSGLITVLRRRTQALGWTATVLGEPPPAEQLAAMRLHALVLDPALTGAAYLDDVAGRLPGLALLAVSAPVPVAERVRGLRAGADDWITKPYHPDELIARIESVLRRRRRGDLPQASAMIVAGELAIRPDRFDAYAGERAAGLSRKEYELLALLAGADGRVMPREEIYQAVWGYTMARGDRSVDVFVRKLRHKLAEISPDATYVHTHFGIGYRFAAQAGDGSDPDPGDAVPGRASARPAVPARTGEPPAGRTLVA